MNREWVTRPAGLLERGDKVRCPTGVVATVVDDTPVRSAKHSPGIVSWMCVTEDEGRAVKLTVRDTDPVDVLVR